ncbi:Gfo/Idh/MocA family oxidoreductase [Chryseolinea sp. H1M3-3]|uniref:Gfo/Idh/MocA family protein n=1 Tax=Chryseolinea sp. H1M3-3 TaxID=3034144 RepID=UPI0023ECBCAB|nr:Gfo/Idh/MocA family oxidoreductase [Chryseolinea sp. H1M3-3]
MVQKIRWGILGCGNIANKFAADLKWVDDAELVAVASRSQQKAMDLATKYGVRHAFDSYEALVTCPDVDVVYVATPHGLHHEHVLLCVNHKKAVLCEKAFALNAHLAKEMIQAAKKNQVFIMEAFWTKFLPQYQKIVSLIRSGEIGDVKMIQADFGFKAVAPLNKRLYEPALGGGALLDIGIYPVFLAISLLGKPSEIVASMKPFPSGVDQQIAIILKFESGVLANLSATFEAVTPVEATIAGTEGYIRMTNRFHNAVGNVALIKNAEHIDIGAIHREVGYGYQFEARHVGECLRKDLLESPIMSHADTMLLMETLDSIRVACGIRYPVDEMK